ncbi:helix-turn-helix transcriptional regulator [Oceanicella actignis]|uniref:Transcriptional regulator, AlpA family n=1 Tax=Oceanicella actignis TaxID=1189325 RepID=A0A1M7SNC8_9RHOB|nr:AlpA family phage regulatory protein [Oceanicella actignis]SES64410.1 transcriptional regulator, AlpA family [Oceanicella actignis]SHN59963.1 transcriptional regulator, AlpA family [Oceanicella actignis]
MVQRLLRLNEVLAFTGLSRSVLYELQARGEFPRAVRIAERAVAWREDDIAEWINTRPLASDDKSAA